MWFTRMSLEDWFDRYQYEVEYDICESAVKYLTFEDIGINLGKLPLRYGFHKGRPDLRGYLAEQYPGLSSEHIIVTSGASEANFAISCKSLKNCFCQATCNDNSGSSMRIKELGLVLNSN